jgi:hypothetical protein
LEEIRALLEPGLLFAADCAGFLFYSQDRRTPTLSRLTVPCGTEWAAQAAVPDASIVTASCLLTGRTAQTQ